ncbi:hypothetical protein EUX98_g4218 [Antrodiella citrinella]|uniref:Uncharacterized protein n=1 Tax=Antrodiella citrinella TaxID=2447956 RepID=A0A4S4MXD1_9APHY|nr:hypothetical protein EUX98_g4218 [Antrodiella citrinella]
MRTAGIILAVFAIALIISAAHGREQSVSQRLLTQMGRDYPKLYAQLEVQREVSVTEHLVDVIGIISNTTAPFMAPPGCVAVTSRSSTFSMQSSMPTAQLQACGSERASREAALASTTLSNAMQ